MVNGLEVGLDFDVSTPFLNMSGGYGICASGEDVFVASQSRVKLLSIPVYGTASLFDGSPPPGTGGLAARRLGPTLTELIAANVDVPPVGIILLQPSQVDQLANFDASDPCDEDSASAAFSDEQLLDGVRVIYYAWPDEWLLLHKAQPAQPSRLCHLRSGSGQCTGSGHAVGNHRVARRTSWFRRSVQPSFH